jgi:hypothetical protein
MRRTLTAIVVACVSVSIGNAGEQRTPPPKPNTDAPENDWRLAIKPRAQPQKIGILTYFPNKGGGYTFIEGKEIAFYALPFYPSTYKADYVRDARIKIDGEEVVVVFFESKRLGLIGTSKMPFGTQTLYRTELKEIDPGVHRRVDTPIAKWSREPAAGKFRLSITAEGGETRLKLKSIIPVLEHAEHGR